MTKHKANLLDELYSHSPTCSCGCQTGQSIDDALSQLDQGQCVKLVLSYPQSCAEVWQIFLTEHACYPGIAFKDLRPGGSIQFSYNREGQESFMLMDYEPAKTLSFAWLDGAILTFDWIPIEVGKACLLQIDYWYPEFKETMIADMYRWYQAMRQLQAKLSHDTFETDPLEEALFREHILREVQNLKSN